MATAKKKATGRYQPGGYKAPEPREVEVDGLGTFLVQPLSTKVQQQIEADTTKNKDESEDDHRGRVAYARMAASIVEPEITAEQLQADADEWTPAEGGEFALKVSLASQAIDDEDLDDVRSRFRSEE